MLNPLQPMFVLTVKKDKGTQDVIGFYPGDQIGLFNALEDGHTFLKQSLNSKRAIIRLEYYNPEG